MSYTLIVSFACHFTLIWWIQVSYVAWKFKFSNVWLSKIHSNTKRSILRQIDNKMYILYIFTVIKAPLISSDVDWAATFHNKPFPGVWSVEGVRRSPLFLEKSASSVLLCDQSQKLVSKSQEMTSGLSKKHHNDFFKNCLLLSIYKWSR